jgi:phosphoglycolate phosphatase-like HAD superfamily hydrolase
MAWPRTGQTRLTRCYGGAVTVGRLVSGAVVAVLLCATPTAANALTPAASDDRDAIAAYYGDDGSGRADTGDSPYARAVGRVVARELPVLRAACSASGDPAVVVDVDDTTLLTYDMYVGAMHYRLDRVVKSRWVKHRKFDAVPGMADLLAAAAESGCRIVVISGRPSAQKAATLANLKRLGFPRVSKYFGRPPGAGPVYLRCADGCTTAQFKTRTRAHVERAGIDIVANIGDQRSDSAGGHSGRVIRIPNRMYTVP